MCVTLLPLASSPTLGLLTRPRRVHENGVGLAVDQRGRQGREHVRLPIGGAARPVHCLTLGLGPVTGPSA
jgi:hypothetical protein